MSGTPLIPLNDDGGEIDIDEELFPTQVTALLAGELYVNIHTADNPTGEIRGQLYLQGSGETCPAGAVDAGTDSGSGSSGSSGTSSSGSNGATTERPDAGDSSSPAVPTEDDGCSTTGSAPGSGLAIAVGVSVALAALSRTRRKR
jgi:hypothetical protein